MKIIVAGHFVLDTKSNTLYNAPIYWQNFIKYVEKIYGENTDEFNKKELSKYNAIIEKQDSSHEISKISKISLMSVIFEKEEDFTFFKLKFS